MPPSELRSGRHWRLISAAKLSKSRIKRLRELRRPPYRLRVDEFRVYYDVEGAVVTILGIVAKSASYDWLANNSEPDHD